MSAARPKRACPGRALAGSHAATAAAARVADAHQIEYVRVAHAVLAGLRSQTRTPQRLGCHRWPPRIIHSTSPRAAPATSIHADAGCEAGCRDAHKMRLVRDTPRRSGCAYGMRRMRHKSPPTCNRLDDGQTPASLETAGLQDIAPRLAAHPFHKAMFALPWDALRLPGSLHRCCIVPFPREYTK